MASNVKHEIEMTCSEELGTDMQRAFVKDYMSRAVPGIRHAFMSEGTLRSSVRIQRSPRKMKITVDR